MVLSGIRLWLGIFEIVAGWSQKTHMFLLTTSSLVKATQSIGKWHGPTSVSPNKLSTAPYVPYTTEVLYVNTGQEKKFMALTDPEEIYRNLLATMNPN